MTKKTWIPVAAGLTALALVGGMGVAGALHKNDVTLVVDGVSRTIAVREDTVAQVLDLEGIGVGAHDVVLPAPETPIKQGMEISVAFGRPLEVTVDGEKRQVWTTARSVGEALAFLNLDAADSKFSASRSATIGRSGLSLEIATAKDVTLTVAGKPSQLTVAGTVADALAKAGITPDADDKVTPAADADLADGLAITFVDVETKTRSQLTAIPFTKSEVKSDKLDRGTSKVTTEGRDGVARETWLDTFEDGVLAGSVLQGRVVSAQPVQQVTTVGTRKPAASSGGDLSQAVGSTCKASYYWEPQMTASGERFNPNAMTAAHKTLPLGSRVKVTNLANGRTTIVRINDRGPYIAGRCLDLSRAAMQAVGGTSAGVIRVAYQVVG